MPDGASRDTGGTRRLILDSALHEFSGRGYHKATIDGIAAGDGLSKGAVYWHFDSKRVLFLATIRRELTRFMEYLQEITREGGLTVEERLERFIVAALAYDFDHPEHPLLMRHFSTLQDEELQQDLQGIARPDS
ncbi:MAG: TetR/AcrR family transcriptional regulator [Actinobacteria bacterium]|nr:TetR/AcrR family transcriptional regulator [Actinomycetota bacterium]